MKARIVFWSVVMVLAVWAVGCGSDPTEETPIEDTGNELATDVVVLPDTAGDSASQDSRQPADVASEVVPFEYECETGKREACLTACGSAGNRLCLKEWGPCIPPAEFCGNCVDDDCNGMANEGCPPNPDCGVVEIPKCPVARITIQESTSVDSGTTVHLSAGTSTADEGHQVTEYKWVVQAPAGSASTFVPGAEAKEVTFTLDVAGQYLFSLDVWDEAGTKSCMQAILAVTAKVYPPLDPEIGCADGQREGFLNLESYPQIAGCFGAWEKPGVTPDSVVPTCNRQGGDDGAKKDGMGCSSADLCAEGWHVCSTWKEVAAKSPAGCSEAVPPDAKSKSIFFAVRQPSYMGSECGEWGDGFNDIFGCGNLGSGLSSGKNCGPLDRVIASTQPNVCGFNEAEPPLGPYECKGGADSHLNEGALVTKKGCQNNSCSYDGVPLGPSDKGGVLCCTD